MDEMDGVWSQMEEHERKTINAEPPLEQMPGGMEDSRDKPFAHGDRVRVIRERDRIGTVQGEPRKFAGELYFAVAFSDGTVTNFAQADLEFFREASDIRSLIESGAFGSRQNLSALITLTKLQGDLSNHVYAFYASRTQFYPHQFKPVLKYVDSPKKRLLVADEVGLGKTIEAGLILAEERARNPLRRVLVVCPSALRQKWEIEMSQRFDEEFRILDGEELRAFIRDVDRRGDAVTLRGICSLQSIRNETLLEELQASLPHLDLVIIDEAHHLRNPETLSHRAGRMLAECADGMVLMTATPIHLGNENLFNLLRVLDEEEFQEFKAFERRLASNEPIVHAQRIMAHWPPDIKAALEALRGSESTADARRFLENSIYQDVLGKLRSAGTVNLSDAIAIQRDLSDLNLLSHILTRTRKREVREASPVRSPVILRPPFTPREMQCYQELTQFCIAWYARFSDNPVEGFASITLQRQMASCLPATIERYMSAPRAPNLIDPEEHGLDVEEIQESLPPAPAGPMIAQDPTFQSLLRTYADLRTVDSKFDEFARYLHELEESGPGRQVLVFTYFKGTVAYLARRLAELRFKCLTVSGDVPSTPGRPETDERARRFEQFRKGEVRILISTEVGSEGLDLQFCHILVNYDLPWNPMVVEQRIGRLDRLGQESPRIVIANFSVPGTIEDRVISRLYQRIGIFEHSIGELEPILGEQIRNLTRILMSSQLSDEEQERQIGQTAAILERKRQELVDLERNSAHLIGHDEFYDLELDRVRKLRRYVTAQELRVLVEEFLRREFPASTLEGEDTVCDLVVESKLLQFLRDVLPETDRWLLQFLNRTIRGRIAVTFDSQTAYRRPEVEFLGNTHPLVRAIKLHYQRNPATIHPVSRVLLGTSAAPAGDYLFEILLLDVLGIRRTRVLEPIFIGVADVKALSPDLAEEIVALIVEQGETLEEIPTISRERTRSLLEAADDVFGARLTARKSEVQRSNEALVSNRLSSLDGTYRVKMERQRSRLSKAQAQASKPQFIRMLETTLRRIESEYGQKREDLVRARDATITFKLIGGGYLRIQAKP
ncbi:MAG: DEAD/DEAH box helicase family protein [Planctomycetes bacterium]|nr:DEAD/DEAH box helicase family protein [Planctomycetota bacterium]